jgi:hypothetical protein
MLVPLLKELDDRIVRDGELNESLFAQLTANQRELGLTFGDRPTCPFFARISLHALSTMKWRAQRRQLPLR